MKKTFIAFIIAVFALPLATPIALAAESKNAQLKQRQNKHGEKNKINKNTIQLQLEELAKKYPKIRMGKAELVKIKGDSLPTEIVVKVLRPKNDKIRVEKNLRLDNVEKMEVEKTYTIKVDEDTMFFRRYWGKSKLSELTVGDHLFLVVADFGNDNYKGLLVKDNSIFLRGMRGTVEKIDYERKIFVIKRGNKKLSVSVTDDTKLTVPGVVNPTFKDIKLGDKVGARGVINGRLHNMDAWSVKVYRLLQRVIKK